MQLTDVQAEQVTPSCDTSLEDDSCSVATCQEAAPVMRDTREAHSQTELESVRDSGVQAAPPVSESLFYFPYFNQLTIFKEQCNVNL